MQSNLTEKLKKVKLVVMDVDGTLTDGGMYYTAEGDVMKRFYVQDGMGITLLKFAHIEVALLTSENSHIVQARGKKLGIKHVIIGCKEKKKALQELTQELNLTLEEVAYIGDDINDAPPMKIVGISACPNDAVDLIQKIATYKCSKLAGHGAVREFIELLLAAQGKSNELPEKW
ncbi:MAG: family hydrolase [Chlamydiales bacterium]|jgi:3-deoxy-D-manno-octulosonate 8-phosphate phosphatase (KDO 8-P phosphatase)|nr:family hydrolase [Chlamydiales bacterium]